MPRNKHDRFFRAVFSRPPAARSLIRLRLHRRLLAAADLSRLRLCPGTFVDEELAEHATDLLFTLPVAGRETLIYVS